MGVADDGVIFVVSYDQPPAPADPEVRKDADGVYALYQDDAEIPCTDYGLYYDRLVADGVTDTVPAFVKADAHGTGENATWAATIRGDNVALVMIPNVQMATSLGLTAKSAAYPSYKEYIKGVSGKGSGVDLLAAKWAESEPNEPLMLLANTNVGFFGPYENFSTFEVFSKYEFSEGDLGGTNSNVVQVYKSSGSGAKGIYGPYSPTSGTGSKYICCVYYNQSSATAAAYTENFSDVVSFDKEILLGRVSATDGKVMFYINMPAFANYGISAFLCMPKTTA